MKKQMIVGYSRVSSPKQAKKGNSLEFQERLLRENGATVVYREVNSGMKIDRPQLTRLLESLEEGDTLMVTSLDRLVRAVRAGSELIDNLLERGVKVEVLDIGVLDNTPNSKYIRNNILVRSEHEVEMLKYRTMKCKAIAKLKPGYIEGRPSKKS